MCSNYSVAYRIESGRLDRAQRTPQGGFRVNAAVGRTGILEYLRADGSKWREYRPPEEAFAADSLASLQAATVTDLHPSSLVTPQSYREVTRGHVGEGARADEDGQHIVAPLYIQDAELIRGVESGERREVSAGYHVDLDLTPGTTPDGQPYDAVQRRIRYNHVAVGPSGWGRAGPTVALRLDGDLNSTISPAVAGSRKEREIMKLTLRVDGVDREIDVEEPAAKVILAAMAERDAETKRLRSDAEEATAARAEAERERDKAKGRADSLEEEARNAADPKAITAMVAARVDLETKARTLRGDVKTDGLSDREVMGAALGLELTDEISDGYLLGRFDAATELASHADASHRSVRAVASHADAAGGLCDMELAQLRAIERAKNGWKGQEA